MSFLNNIFSLLFPRLCQGCQNRLQSFETIICVACNHDLELSNYTQLSSNPVFNLFQGRAKIQSAVSYLMFTKTSITKELIYNLKYKNKQNIGVFLANRMLLQLTKSIEYSTVDYVIPVPLHKSKLRKRGYNQLSKFGKTLASGLDAQYFEGLLIKKTATLSQTGKAKSERWNAIQDSFHLTNTTKLSGKHIVLIDDVITTGSTLEACCKTLHQIDDLNISIVSIAHSV